MAPLRMMPSRSSAVEGRRPGLAATVVTPDSCSNAATPHHVQLRLATGPFVRHCPRLAAVTTAAPQVIGHFQMRDFDPVGPTRLNPGFDGCSHVVDVDVHVPQTSASDNHKRVTERAEFLCITGTASSDASSRNITS